MSPYRGSLVLAGCLTLILTASLESEPPGGDSRPPLGGQKPARVDAYGDPLPAGALARMGSVRFRPGSRINDLVFSPDGKILASLGGNGNTTSYGGGPSYDGVQEIRLWDFATGRELRQLQTLNGRHGRYLLFRTCVFSADSKVFSVLGESGLLSWDVASGRKIQKPGELPGKGEMAILSISPDGKTIATVDFNQANNQTQTVRLSDAETGKEICQLEAPAAKSGDWAGAWQVVKGYLVGVLLEMLLEDDARHMARHIVNTQNFTPQPLVFSPDGKQVAASVFNDTGECKLHAWDTAIGKKLWEPIGGMGNPNMTGRAGVCYSPDGKLLAWTDGNSFTIHLLEAATGKELWSLPGKLERPIRCSAFTPDGKNLVLADQEMTGRLQVMNGALFMVDAATGKEVKRWEEQAGIITAMAFSPDGKTIALGGEYTVRLLDTATWKLAQLSRGHEGAIESLALLPDGKTLFTTGSDQTGRLWDKATGKELRRFDFAQGKPMNGSRACLSPDGKLLALGEMGAAAKNETGALHLLELATGKEVGKVKLPVVGVPSLVFSPNGKILATTGSDGMVRLHDPAQGKEVGRFRVVKDPMDPDDEYGDSVLGLAFAPDGKTLATLSPVRDKDSDKDPDQDPDDEELMERRRDPEKNTAKIQIWEIASGKERRGIPFQLFIESSYDDEDDEEDFEDGSYFPAGSHALIFSPRGQTVAMGRGKTIRLFDVVRGKELRRFSERRLKPQTAAFSADGKYLAAGSLTGFVHVWETDTGTAVGRFPTHHSGINSLVFAADAKTLITAGDDGTALVWDVAGLIEEAGARPAAVTDDKLESLWLALAGEDAAKAGQAMQSLAADPKQAAPFLKRMLKPAPAAVAPQVIEQLIGQLDSDQFNEREKAMQALEKLERMAEPALRQALAKPQVSLEVRRRLERLLEKLEGPVTSPEALQALRALEILEQLGTAEARGVLEDLARGAAEAGLTQEAKAALERLAKRQP